jgi:hypothetical protein
MNPNDTVKIKPTDEGWRQIVKYVDEANDKLKMHPKVRHRMAVPVPDAEGYISDQFYSLMQYFDWNSVLAAGDVLLHDMQIPSKQGDCEPLATIRMVCYGDDLSGGDRGNMMGDDLINLFWNPAVDVTNGITLDFAGVKTIDHSFAEEAFGVLEFRSVKHIWSRIHFINHSQVRETILEAVQKRTNRNEGFGSL